MSAYHLAQHNIALMKAPLESPEMADFVANLERINALAEAAPGYVWRLQDEAGDATAIRPFGDDVLVNMSVWQDAESLFAFVYRSGHTPEMARRREYFLRFEGAYQALWWVPEGHRPSIDEGLSRLWMLDRYGPTPQSFTFKARFPQPGLADPPVDMKPDPWCIGQPGHLHQHPHCRQDGGALELPARMVRASPKQVDADDDAQRR